MKEVSSLLVFYGIAPHERELMASLRSTVLEWVATIDPQITMSTETQVQGYRVLYVPLGDKASWISLVREIEEI